MTEKSDAKFAASEVKKELAEEKKEAAEAEAEARKKAQEAEAAAKKEVKEAEESKARIAKELEKLEVDTEAEKKDCLEKATALLQHHGGETNIPLTSPYWNLMSTYRRLERK